MNTWPRSPPDIFFIPRQSFPKWSRDPAAPPPVVGTEHRPEAQPTILNSPQSDTLAGSAVPADHISMDAVPLVFVVQMFQVCVAGFGPFQSGGRDVVTADVGQTVELSCETAYKVEVAAHVLWYKQRADEAPTAIKTADCTQTGCRATLKKGRGDNTSTLEIRDAQVEDSGFYYCSGHESNAEFSRGLTLLVGDSSTDETSLLVFVPQFETNDSVPLVCQVSGLSSNMVVIYWNISGQLTEGRSDSGRIEPDQSYSVRSQVLVPPGVWWSGEICTCIVQLGGADKTRTKSVPRPIPTPDHAWCDITAIGLSMILVVLLILVPIWIYKTRTAGIDRRREGRQGRGNAAQVRTRLYSANDRL